MKKIVGILTVLLVLIFSQSCVDSSLPELNELELKVVSNVIPVNRYIATPYIRSSIEDKIKYSFSYENYDFYYIYLGELSNIPIYSHTARYYDGEIDWTYTITKERITQNSISEAISENMQATIGVIDSHTVSKTTGGKVGLEINASFGKKDIFNIGGKASGEYNWSNLTSDTFTNSLQRSTSLTDTLEHATTHTWRTLESDQFRLSPNNKIGYYKYTLFSTSDVYLYVIRDSNTNEIFYEFKEHVIPGNDAYFWRLDYSETPSFRKSDATNFEFDVSLLNDLSKPELKPKLDLSSTNLTGTVEISGTPQVESILTANIILINSSGPFNYQWMRNGTIPIGENNNTYTLQSADLNSTISVIVTCVNLEGSVSSSATSTIFPEPISLYTLTVIQNLVDGGTVNLTSQSNIGAGTPIYIIASARPGYRFVNWEVTSGTASINNDNNASTTVTLISNVTIRANFQELIRIERHFTTAGNHSFLFNEGVPATIEVYALGAGGGGQGGSSSRFSTGLFSSDAYWGTGGAGGGGAAAYMRFDVSGSTSININVGKGGTGGQGIHRPVGQNARSGLRGVDGGSTTINWNGNILTVVGGKGGGEGRPDGHGGSGTDQPREIRTGGSGGAVSSRPPVIVPANWDAIQGGRGANGNATNYIHTSAGGGNAGLLNIGYYSPFGGEIGGRRISGQQWSSSGSTPVGRGAGGAGGYGDNYGYPGGDGHVIIVVTYYK